MYTSVEHDCIVRPVMRDHLSLETAFAGQKEWSPKTGSTVKLLSTASLVSNTLD